MAMGSERLYRWINENPSVSMHPSTYTHSLSVISKIDRFIAINSGLQVDLTGQVNGEMIGDMPVSGIGGGIDFARGALASRNGLSIIALSSTTNGGEKSRIIPFLPQGAPVTYHRSDVDIIVTEQGIADLRGKSLKERAIRLIEIAHPKFREELKGYLKKFDERRVRP
jgi:4-hydroxybutyrate CoA-transferase